MAPAKVRCTMDCRGRSARLRLPMIAASSSSITDNLRYFLYDALLFTHGWEWKYDRFDFARVQPWTPNTVTLYSIWPTSHTITERR